MKKLSPINKFIYFINYIVAILLLIGYTLPHISPKLAPKLAVMSLTLPMLIIANLLFGIYWLFGLKKQVVLSVFCLGVGYFVSLPLYIFKDQSTTVNNEFTVMNYNVRLFNKYNWFKDKEIPEKIANFVKENNPDILCIQEYTSASQLQYPYQFIKLIKGSDFGQAIFSKYKIINQGSLDFKHTPNNAIFIDFIKDRDTIRIYNIHLESLGLNVNKENFGQKSSEKLFNRVSKEFLKQQEQVTQIIQHKNQCKYPVILSGDFNNTAYSWTYKEVKGKMTDSFIEAGKGFGATFELKKIPLRIDFIFADKTFIFTKHKNYKVNYSDHKPIMAKIGI